MKQIAAVAAAALLAASAAFAQTSTTNPAATSGQQMTDSQVKQKLQHEGYSNVTLERAPSSGSSSSGSTTSSGATRSLSNQPEWTGTATKNGKEVHIQVNSQGQATETQR